jgi:hypothetical protein
MKRNIAEERLFVVGWDYGTFVAVNDNSTSQVRFLIFSCRILSNERLAKAQIGFILLSTVPVLHPVRSAHRSFLWTCSFTGYHCQFWAIKAI